jgi:predicted nucleotidyltransferase
MGGDIRVAVDVRARIMAELARIETEHDVRLVFAVESGSRAWGFPSTDSDYDVRFVYAERPEAYCSVFARRDVIQRPIDGTLDISGWDLRKALRLMARSNPAFLEWLASPIRYCGDPSVVEEVLQLGRDSVFLPSLAYHYDRWSRRIFDDVTASEGPVRLKAYCYALRAALSYAWIRRTATPPPMDLPTLMSGGEIPGATRDATDALVTLKATATEHDAMPRSPELDTFIGEILADRTERPPAVERPVDRARFDTLFRKILR